MSWPEAFLWAFVSLICGLTITGSIALIMIFRDPPWRSHHEQKEKPKDD